MDYNLMQRLLNADTCYGQLRLWREGKHSGGTIKAKNYYALKKKKRRISKLSRRRNRPHK